jgi:sec-independent protein translocase protein TatB
MFDIGFPELVVIAIVGLLVIGPERLPEALRTLGLWLGRMRRSFTAVKAEIEKEIGMDEVRRQLHNEAIMEEMKRIEAEVKNTASAARTSLGEGARQAQPGAPATPPVIDPNAQGNVADLLAEQGGESIAPRPDKHPNDSDDSDSRDHSDAGRADDVDEPATDRGHADAVDDRDHADAAGDGTAAPAPVKDAAKGN